MMRSLTLLAWGAFTIAGTADAQEQDARVLRFGELSLTAHAQYWHVDSRSGSGGNGIAAPLEGPLTPISFSSLGVVRDRLRGFLDETADQPDAVPVDPENLSAGTLSIDGASSARVIPIRIAGGILPRVELGFELPVYRTERLFRRLDLSDGNVGINPDPEANEALFEGLSDVGGELGASAILPVAGTELGDELQKRVLALTGDQLILPQASASGLQLQRASPVLPESYFISLWHPGDLEMDARARLFGSFGDAPFPTVENGRVHHRLTVSASVRFPTGRRALPDYNVGVRPLVGFAGASAGAAADLFLGERAWFSAGGAYAVFSSADVLVFLPGPEGPFTDEADFETISRTPGSRLDLWLTPRLRLSQSISLGTTLRTERVLEGSDRVAGADLPIAGGSRHSAGFSIRYTTLPVANARGFDIAAGYAGAIAGSDGLDAWSRAFFQVSIQQRILGR